MDSDLVAYAATSSDYKPVAVTRCGRDSHAGAGASTGARTANTIALPNAITDAITNPITDAATDLWCAT
jgi:hypothetical protein